LGVIFDRFCDSFFPVGLWQFRRTPRSPEGAVPGVMPVS
jgi:hypothetical protein